MIIDVHGHIVAPPELYLYREYLIGTRGHYGRQLAHIGAGSATRSGKMDPEALRAQGELHIAFLDDVGTDMQLISARPYSLMHSEKPSRIVHWWAAAVNDAIAEQVSMFPTRLQGIANLPQAYGEPVSVVFDELERCVDLGFVGVLLNPDPSEGRGYVPPLGDEYWFPLYEKLVEHRLPAHIHSCGCASDRESQSLHFINEESVAVMSLIDAQVWDTFPDLQIVVAHGGGAIPYQVGRFRGVYWKERNIPGSFDDNLRKLYFDTCLYSDEAIALLLHVVGADRALFGTERPGDGLHQHPAGTRSSDDIRTTIESLASLSSAEKAMVLGENTLKVFPRLAERVAAATAVSST